jgi:hypothetical protein
MGLDGNLYVPIMFSLQMDVGAPEMNPEKMAMLTEKTADALIEALKIAPLVNITWGSETGMLCGNPFAETTTVLDVSCGNEEQAWAINRAKGAISQGDEAAARAHLAPLIRKPLHH